MSEIIATLIKVEEESLRDEIHESLLADQLLAILSDNPQKAREFITVTDDPDYDILNNELVIFVGKTQRKDFFAQVNTNSTEICRAIKRGYFQWETVNMNKAAQQSVQTHKDSLEKIATETFFAINNFANLKEIKLSIPDVLPVGVAVIDSDGKVVYVNQAFQRLSHESTARLPGKAYTALFTDSVVQLIAEPDSKSCLTIMNGIEVSVRKAPLKSASTKQGLVLVFTEV